MTALSLVFYLNVGSSLVLFSGDYFTSCVVVPVGFGDGGGGDMKLGRFLWVYQF